VEKVATEREVQAMADEKGCPEVECAECAESPWPQGTSYVTTAFFGMPMLLGAYALLKKAPLRLPIFLGLWVAITTVLRKFVCCRCEFYGKDCSTLMGKWTAILYEKDEEHPLTAQAFYLDFALIGASILFPLPQVKKMGKGYLVLYLMVLMAGALATRLLGCANCPIAVCPMNPDRGDFGG
jgi:hypothetical protein